MEFFGCKEALDLILGYYGNDKTMQITTQYTQQRIRMCLKLNYHFLCVIVPREIECDDVQSAYDMYKFYIFYFGDCIDFILPRSNYL